MYICLCHGVTETDIHNCVEEGANSLRELRECLGVGSQCGKCARHARAILRERAKNADASGLLAGASLSA